MNRSNERGVAMIIALFMVLAMSVLGATLMFVSQTETLSSMN
jgi:type II secretory pathway component PulK